MLCRPERMFFHRATTRKALAIAARFGCSSRMNTIVQAGEKSGLCTIRDVLAALKKQKIQARHDKQDWGDWIILKDSDTVISIESVHGRTSTATIEHAEDEASGLARKIEQAFHALGWVGVGEDGTYPLG